MVLVSIFQIEEKKIMNSLTNLINMKKKMFTTSLETRVFLEISVLLDSI